MGSVIQNIGADGTDYTNRPRRRIQVKSTRPLPHLAEHWIR